MSKVCTSIVCALSVSFSYTRTHTHSPSLPLTLTHTLSLRFADCAGAPPAAVPSPRVKVELIPRVVHKCASRNEVISYGVLPSFVLTHPHKIGDSILLRVFEEPSVVTIKPQLW